MAFFFRGTMATMHEVDNLNFRNDDMFEHKLDSDHDYLEQLQEIESLFLENLDKLRRQYNDYGVKLTFYTSHIALGCMTEKELKEIREARAEHLAKVAAREAQRAELIETVKALNDKAADLKITLKMFDQTPKA